MIDASIKCLAPTCLDKCGYYHAAFQNELFDCAVV